jgi:hypothetical protein
MGTYIRAKTKRQRAHMGSRSKGHAADKAAGEIRAKFGYVRVDAAPRPSPVRDLTSLGGSEYKHEGGKWVRLNDPEELSAWLDLADARLNWYNRDTTRNGKPVRMRTPVATPVAIFTINSAPWLSDWIADKLKKNDPRPALCQIRDRLVAKVTARLDRRRYILAFAIHSDTSDLHFDFAISRQDGSGGRLADRNGLDFSGPWLVGTQRQVDAGATISSVKLKQLERDMANHRQRYGTNAVPLDVQFARDLDAIAAEVIGPELAAYRAAYARSVPELERAHATADLAELDQARSKLAEAAAAPFQGHDI